MPTIQRNDNGHVIYMAYETVERGYKIIYTGTHEDCQRFRKSLMTPLGRFVSNAFDLIGFIITLIVAISLIIAFLSLPPGDPNSENLYGFNNFQERVAITLCMLDPSPNYKKVAVLAPANRNATSSLNIRSL